ncbi:1-acyl-sn-glycerol-3-phosphate acyltransferase [Streptomyces sp. NA04227]|uniref:lysophospholipid acyltransferase family protein n=1 Tax=Streptomyces sp. NA04227 TaxID=2742136 RepID=UPI001C37793F|nr:lysophospholipid acyltransferase family protein [Streptomyces sp. NA04227]
MNPLNPWPLEPVCDPSCAGRSTASVSPAVRGRRYAALAYTVAGAVAAGKRLSEPEVVRAKARAVLDGVGLRIVGDTGPLSVPKEESGGTGTLIVANHISWIDVITMLAVEPMTILAKQQVGGWPVIGGLARRLGTRFVHREKVRELPLMIEDMTRLLASGRSVLVFPQATTWCSVAGGGFYRASFQAAVDAGAPVRPVTIDYFQGPRRTRWAGFLGVENFTASLSRVAGAADMTVRVTAHPPIRGTDRRQLAQDARLVINGELAPMHAGPGAVAKVRTGAGAGAAAEVRAGAAVTVVRTGAAADVRTGAAADVRTDATADVRTDAAAAEPEDEPARMAVG